MHDRPPRPGVRGAQHERRCGAREILRRAGSKGVRPMTEQDYWFARTRRPGSGRMTPINAKGWFVVAFFVACMLIGAGLFGVLMFEGKIMAAIASYALFALLGASTFIWLAY